MSKYLMKKHIEDLLEKYSLGESVTWNKDEGDFCMLWLLNEIHTTMLNSQNEYVLCQNGELSEKI